jgi:hypothetical protein
MAAAAASHTTSATVRLTVHAQWPRLRLQQLQHTPAVTGRGRGSSAAQGAIVTAAGWGVPLQVHSSEGSDNAVGRCKVAGLGAEKIADHPADPLACPTNQVPTKPHVDDAQLVYW